MLSKILAAYDGSDPAGRAFSLALDLADKYRAAVRVVAVARPPDFGGDVETEAAAENARSHYSDMLRRLKDRAAGEGRAILTEVVVGHPAERVVEEGQKWGADLIVIGHRGRGLIGRLLMGSIAKEVIHHATCAVLVTR